MSKMEEILTATENRTEELLKQKNERIDKLNALIQENREKKFNAEEGMKAADEKGSMSDFKKCKEKRNDAEDVIEYAERELAKLDTNFLSVEKLNEITDPLEKENIRAVIEMLTEVEKVLNEASVMLSEYFPIVDRLNSVLEVLQKRITNEDIYYPGTKTEISNKVKRFSEPNLSGIKSRIDMAITVIEETKRKYEVK